MHDVTKCRQCGGPLRGDHSLELGYCYACRRAPTGVDRRRSDLPAKTFWAYAKVDPSA